MKITYQQVEKNITNIANRTEYTADFLYELLAAYGRSSSAITQLRQGVLNKASDKNSVLQKDVVYFKQYPVGTELIEKIEELENDPLTERYQPRYLIATDLVNIASKDTKKKTSLIKKIADLDQEVGFFYGWTGDEITEDKNEAAADRRAADKMKELYSEIEKENLVRFAKEGNTFRHDLNVFFSRLLFCFFAEDTGLFQKRQFTEAIKNYTNTDGSDLNVFFTYLFKALDSEDKSGLSTPFSEFPYVNGTIFDTSKHQIAIPNFNAQARHLIIDCTKSNWGEINPDIFGTIFQGIVDAQKRDESGMDYTSVPNILKVIEPLFLNELHEFFDKNYNDVNRLLKLLDRISKIKIFDPACGSGNFLIISYKELRELEHAVIARLNELSPTHKYSNSGISTLIKLENFYGIEIDDFAHEIAVLSLYLAAHQMNVEFEKQFGKKISIIPLIDIPTIICGNAARLDWQKICPNIGHIPTKTEQKAMFDFGEPEQQKLPVDKVVYDEIYLIGNPPYKGKREQTIEQKGDLKYVFNGKINSFSSLDYISIWFWKGSKYIENTKAKLAFVSTNSITQGEQVGLLWPFVMNSKLEFNFVYTSFKWQNSARDQAGVTVIILGLRNVSTDKKYMYSNGIKTEVKNINYYLSMSDIDFINKSSKPISFGQIVKTGSRADDKKGKLIFLQEEYNGSVIDKKYFRQIMGGDEFINDKKRYALWLNETDIEKMPSEIIENRLNSLKSKRKNYWQFKKITLPKNDFIFIPQVSSERYAYIPIGFVEKNIIPLDPHFFIDDAPLWLFAVLESKMHMVWIRTVCGKLKTDYRYSSTLGYNTFPVSPLSDEQKEKLKQSARKILLTRENHSEKTLAEMYDPNKMPTDLRDAHDENDHIVDQLYRQKGFADDNERLSVLFDLYEQMTKKQKRS